MTATITTTGSGSIGNVSTWSVTEEASPLIPGDTSGGAGTMNITADRVRAADSTNSIYLGGSTVTIVDTVRGTVTGTISDTEGVRSVTINADGLRVMLNVDRVAAPKYDTTVQAAFIYYLGLVGISAGSISVLAPFDSQAAVFVGWSGNVLDYMKMLCASLNAEMSVINGVITLRPARTNTLSIENISDSDLSTNTGDLAQNVAVSFQNAVKITNGIIYPITSEAPVIIQVGAGETYVTTIQTKASLVTINQPVVADSVTIPYGGTTGTYSVIGSDGLPITAAQWVAYGGNLVVELTDNPFEIQITVTGASTLYSPYRIAVTDGDNTYNTLYITGTGLLAEPQTLTLPTGITSSLSSNELGITVNSPFTNTLLQAYDNCRETAKQWGSPTATFTGTVEGGVFGNSAGAIITRSEGTYRVSTSTMTVSTNAFTAIGATTNAELQTAFTGMTYTQVQALFSGLTYLESFITPFGETNAP